MIHIIEGDLLQSNCTAIAHQANCFSVMEAGFAGQLKTFYPEAYVADRRFKMPPKERLGRFSFVLSEDRTKLIFNLYGQFRYGKGKVFTDYEALESSLDQMFRALDLAEKKGFGIKIGLPYGMGTGCAGGEWERIYKKIEHLTKKYNREVYLYKLNGR